MMRGAEVGCGLGLRVVIMCSSRSEHWRRGYAVMFFIAITQFMRDTLLQPINVCAVAHEEGPAGLVDRATLVVAFHAGILCASKRVSKDTSANLLTNTESIRWKRLRSGDRPGLQNRREAGNPVTDGFDSHSLPPFVHNELRTFLAVVSL